MQLLQLNEDIWFLILSQLGRTDASKLMETCRMAYNLALPRFLHEIDIDHSMRKDGRLTAFCNFMLADPTRPRCLREVVLYGSRVPDQFEFDSYIDPSDVPLLVEVIRKAQQVTELTIVGSSIIVEMYPELLDAFASLPSLHTLCFNNCGSPVVKLLWLTTSRPMHLKLINCVLTGSSFLSFGPLPDSLTTSARTMELRVRSRYDEDNDLTVEDMPDIVLGLVWPSVEQLDFSGWPDRQLVNGAFPNLVHLHNSGDHGRWLGDRPQVHWPMLDSVYSYSPLRLTSPLSKATFRHTCQIDQEFATLLENMSPVVLSFNACLHNAVYCDKLGERLKDSGALQRMRFLELFTWWDPSSAEGPPLDDETISRVMTYVSTFRHGPLVGIAIWHAQPSLSLDGEAMKTLAQDIAALVPTLEYVGLGQKEPGLGNRVRCRTTRLEFAPDYKWYTIGHRGSGSPQVALLTDDEGDAVELRLDNLAA